MLARDAVVAGMARALDGEAVYSGDTLLGFVVCDGKRYGLFNKLQAAATALANEARI